MSFKKIPEHKEYYCDFFCGEDASHPRNLPVKALHGLRLKASGHGANFPVLLDPLNENASLHVCLECLAAFAALYHQVKNREHQMNQLNTEKLELRK